MKKRLLAMLLALAMCVSMIEVPAFAAEADETPAEQPAETVEEPAEEDPEETPEEVPEEEPEETPDDEVLPEEDEPEADSEESADADLSGSCGANGDNLTWTLTQNNEDNDDPTYTLTITGSGDMYSYSSNSDWGWFNYLSSITAVAFPDGLTSIGAYAFNGGIALTSVEIPANVTSIKEFAFADCIGLTSITLPEDLASLDVFAFSGCSSLTSVTFEGAAPEFGNNVFSGDTAICYYPAGDSTWNTIVEANEQYGGTLTWEAYTSEHDHVLTETAAAAATCTEDGNSAYYTCSVCGKYFSDENGTTEIEENSWVIDALGHSFTNYVSNGDYTETAACDNGCGETDTRYVSSVKAHGPCGASLTWTLTQNNTDNSNPKYTLTIEGSGAMYEFSSVADRGWNDYAASVTAVSLSADLTSIGAYAFCLCYCLTSVEIPANVTSISEYAFCNCYDLESVEIPANVTSIAKYAFYNCDDLTSVTIPSGVTSIGRDAFSYCTKLTSVTFEGAAPDFGGDAFGHVTATCRYPIDDSTWNTIAEANEQYGGTLTWEGVHKLTLAPAKAATCTEAGNSAYYTCSVCGKYFSDEACTTEIEENSWVINAPGHSITFVSAAAPTCTEAGNSAYYTCSVCGKYFSDENGTTEIEENSCVISALGHSFTNYVSDGEYTETAACDNGCGETDTRYVSSVKAHGSCGENLTWVLTQNNEDDANPTYTLTVIGSGAMYYFGFPGWYDYDESITAVSLPSGLTSIYDDAFWGCLALTSITIPEDVTSIDSGAFGFCNGLTSVTFEGEAPTIGDNAFRNVTATCWYPAGDDSWDAIVEANEQYGGYQLTWKACFPEHDHVLTETAAAAATCTEAGNRAYYTCSVCGKYFSDENGTTEIEEDSWVISAKGHSFTNYVSDGEYTETAECDNGCGETDTRYVSSVKDHGSCGADLTWVLTQNNEDDDNPTYMLTIIGSGAMDYSGYPGWYDYRGSITAVSLPSGLMSIGSAAFNGCLALTSITIPEDVTSIDSWAFAFCNGLTSVTFAGNAPEIGSIAFFNVTATCYYPVGDDSWNTIVAANEQYGGTLTWEGVHKLTLAPAKAATCTEDGSDAYYQCTFCGRYFSDENGTIEIEENSWVINAPGHSITFVPAAEPTCTEAGNDAYYTCSACGKYFSDENGTTEIEEDSCVISALGHSFTNYVSDGGYNETAVCDNGCGETDTRYVSSVKDHGSCGDDLTWVLTQNNEDDDNPTYTLTITGSGAMNYSGYPVWYDYRESITAVSLPSGLTSIGSVAFDNCLALTSITIPADVTSIDSWAFSFCWGLTSVTFEGAAPEFGSGVFENVTATCYYPEGDDSWNTIVEANEQYLGTLTWVSYIPEHDHVLTETAAAAATCTEAGNRAYYTCSVCGKYFSDENGTTEIEENSWVISAKGHSFTNYVSDGEYTETAVCDNGCGETDTRYVSSVKAQGSCGDDLTWVLTQNNEDDDNPTYTLTITGSGDMYDYSVDDPGWQSYASSVTAVSLPADLTSIGAFAFYKCSALTSVEIPANVTSIGSGAFRACGNLASIALPKDLTSIGDVAFRDCSSLTSITIPSGVTNIGINAFSYCSNLTSVTFKGKAPTIGYWAFYGIAATCYYPVGDDSWNTIVENNEQYGGTITWESYEHTHTLTFVEHKEPTCIEDGNYDYYVCSGCGSYFWYEDATGETDADEVVWPAGSNYHNYVFTYEFNGQTYTEDEWDALEVKPTCQEHYTEVKTCSCCGDMEMTDCVGSHDPVYTYTVDGTDYTSDEFWSGVWETLTCANTYAATYSCPNCTLRGSYEATGNHVYVHNYTYNGRKYDDAGFDAIYDSLYCDDTYTDSCVCVVCGDSYTDDEMTGEKHDWVFTYNGQDYTEDELDALLETLTCEDKIPVEYECPRCQWAGETTYSGEHHYEGTVTCNGKEYTEEEFEAVYDTLTCADSYTAEITCRDCGETLSQTGRGEHSYTNYVPTQITVNDEEMWVEAAECDGGCGTKDYRTSLAMDFMIRLYEVCLGREPDQGGLAWWTNELETGAADAKTAVFNTFFSDEFINKNYCNECFVKTLYLACLDREADEEGLEYWTGLLDSGADTRAQVTAFFLGSEFTAFCDSYGIPAGGDVTCSRDAYEVAGTCGRCGKAITSDAEKAEVFITNLYDICFGRTPDEEGLNFWVNELTTGHSNAKTIVFEYFFSDEYIAKNACNECFVTALYRACLGREPDADGLNYWVTLLETGAETRAGAVNYFLGTEFENLCGTYGIDAGDWFNSDKDSSVTSGVCGVCYKTIG